MVNLYKIIDWDNLKRKIFSAYPNTFSKELKQNGGNYYPLNMPEPLTNQMIRDQIEMKTFGFQYSVDIVTEFLQNVKGSRVIDLGCGFGGESLVMGELGKDIKIYALDADPEKVSLLDSILEKYKFEDNKKGKEKIIPVKGDILNLLDFDENFDGVLIKHMIGYIASCRLSDYLGNTVEAANYAMEDIAEKVMTLVKKIAPNSWLTLRDRDTNEYTREAFMDGIQFALGPTEYRMMPVKMKFGRQSIEEKVLAIDRRVHKKTADLEGENYKSLRRQEKQKQMEEEEVKKRIEEYFLANPLF